VSPEDIDEWLDSWIEAHLAHDSDAGHDGDMDAFAALCRRDAALAGISERGLMAASGGDLAAYLAEEAEALEGPPDF